MKTWHWLILLAACGTEPGGDDVVDPPITRSALEQCVFDGGAVKEAWSAGNQHGPVNSIVVDSLIVLGAADGSVKQWSVDGDEPAYGRPFATQGPPVAALALSANHVIAATQQGQLAEWKLADAQSSNTMTIADVVLSAVAVGVDATQIVTGTTTGELFAFVRATSAMSQLQTQLWGVATIAYATGDRLFTAGHHYGQATIERRSASAPTVAVDTWMEVQATGWVRAIAIDAEAKQLVAGGDGFVAVFAPDTLAMGPLATMAAADHQSVGIVLLPGGELFATAGKEGTLKLWKTATAELVSTLQIPVPIGIASDREGTRLYTSGPDGRLHAFGCAP